MTDTGITLHRSKGRRFLVAAGDWQLPHIHTPSPVDTMPAADVLTMIDALTFTNPGTTSKVRHGARRILAWLGQHPGDGWQDRWFAADGDDPDTWVTALSMADHDRSVTASRDQLMAGLAQLLLMRVVTPSYRMLSRFRASSLFDRAAATRSPELFAKARAAAVVRNITGRRLHDALVALTKLVLHTGKDLDQLTADDFFEARAATRNGTHHLQGLGIAWDLCTDLQILATGQSMRTALRSGQLSCADLVATYNLQCRPVGEVLVRYLDERRPAVDYGTLRGLAWILADRFWADLEQHHPGIDSLALPPDVAAAWRERLAYIEDPRAPGGRRPRRDVLSIMMRVRSFYLDIQEWALEDPSWAQWAAPSPVRKSDTQGRVAKYRNKLTAEMHQRVRDRLPRLPLLVATAEQRRDQGAAFLAAASATPTHEEFGHGGNLYRRFLPKSHNKALRYIGADHVIWADDLRTGQRINITSIESRAFWSWAIIETLRHTGLRIEELLELTHLALVSHELSDTGEIVPLLQVVPSKNNRERLLLVTPELASVLATIITRLRQVTGAIPLVTRFDNHERVIGPPLPHLFQAMTRHRNECLSQELARKLLDETLALTGLTDAAGQPLRFTPHDFRRMFATDAVNSGLPVHIAAALLGHQNLTTTQAYLAVFPDQVVRDYRAHVDRRRASRPQAEYRHPTDAEWDEFQRHFALRKLELGTCNRPYGTPCQHEHACIRCPSLRVDPRERGRLAEIIDNLQVRIAEATDRGWLGEAQGLQVSLNQAREKMTDLDARTARTGSTTTELGLPVVRRSG